MKIQAKMRRVKQAMRRWNKETLGDIFDQIKRLKEKIKLIEIQFEINPTKKNREELSHAKA